MSDEPKPRFRIRGAAAQLAPAIILPAAPKLILPAALSERYSKPKEKGFKASPQQLAYFDWIEKGSGNLIMEAVAGAGKSTTLVQGFRYMQGQVFCGAYNKAAGADLRDKATKLDALRPGLHISTMHASGLYDWKRTHKQVEIDDTKPRRLIERFVDDFPAHRDAKTYSAFINKMISFGKQFLIGCAGKPGADNMAVWLKLMDHFSVDQDLPENVHPEAIMEWVMEIFGRSHAECPTRIDFDDMIYAPIAYDIRMFANDWVLVDECQDINPARREMAKRLLKRAGRAVFVGDSRQAIYGFTGAGGDSIDRIVEEFKCERLPLTVTYRCPKAVVNYVHQWVSHIEAHPDAPEGVVRPITYVPERVCAGCQGMGNDPKMPRTLCDVCGGKKRIPALPWFQQDAPANTDVILCRYTRPLIQTAYSMIKRGIACKVEGRDIGRGLITICRMWKIKSIDRLVERVAKWAEHEIAKAIKAESEKRQQEIEDKRDTLLIFMARCKDQGKHLIDDLVAEIESMFADDVKGVITLCTGHKSKGREWPRVFWIQTTGGRISKPWEAVEEINVKYVIGTRAMAELILVPETLGKAA